MTEKLYDKDAYATEFEATVLECLENEDGYAIVLDKTLFFPEEGGQTPDKGAIEGYAVKNVYIKDGIIYHFLTEKVEKGRKIIGIINCSHRFSNMQMHSAEHIFSGLVHKQFGYDNVGFHLSDNDATMDYNGKLSLDDIKRLEREVNEVIWKAVKINTWYPTTDELEQLDYRSKSGIEGSVRMVEIEGIDSCACCAPHVKTTSEIGIFKIVRFESYKGGVRLHYLAGKRAYDYLDSLQECINDLSRKLSSSQDKILENVDKLLKENADIHFTLGKMKRENLVKEIEALYSDKTVFSEKNIVSFFAGEDNSDLLRYGIDKMLELGDKPAFIYSGDDEKGYRFILEGHGESVRSTFEEMKASLQIKGGGKDTSFQGTVSASISQIKKWL